MSWSRPLTWSCPSCLRRVPARVEVCHCGTTREAAERVRASGPAADRPRPWLPALLALAAVGVVSAAILRQGEERASPPPPSPEPAASPTPLRTPPPQRAAPHPSGRVEPSAPTPELTPEPTPPPAAEPTPEPTPEPDSVDRRREEGAAQRDASLSKLRRRLDEVHRRLDSYQAACRTSTSAVQPTGCGAAESEIRSLLDEVTRSVDAAELEARRAWLAPGTRRELLSRAGLDRDSLRRLEREVEESFR